MDGILIMDKPPGMTSATMVAAVKRILGAKKVGHTGTLDPFATGVLVMCLGRATRLARFFLHGEKTYDATLTLGVTTDTQDATGTVTATREVPDLDEETIRRAFERFTGEFEQAPPVYSALKHNGVPLYKLARKGQPVQKPARTVTVFENRITEIALPEVRFTTRCSGGTYVRTLCADVGAALGCGGHLSALCRTENSGFSLSEALSLSGLKELAAAGKAGTALVPMASALPRMPLFVAGRDIVKKIRDGKALTWRELAPDLPVSDAPGAGHVKVVDGEGRLLAVLDPKADGVGLSYCCVLEGVK